MKLNGYETHREDDANLVLRTFSSVDFTLAKLDAKGTSVRGSRIFIQNCIPLF